MRFHDLQGLMSGPTLAALKHTEARDRFRELGIEPEAFTYEQERTIAAALLEERSFNAAEVALLDRDDGQHLPWRLAISWRLDPVWAVEVVDRFAAERIGWWVPRWLQWITQGIDQGQPLSWAVCELEWVLAQLVVVTKRRDRT